MKLNEIAPDRFNVTHYKYVRQNHGASKLYRDMKIIQDDNEIPEQLRDMAKQIMSVLKTEAYSYVAEEKASRIISNMKSFVNENKINIHWFTYGNYRSWDNWLWDMRR